MDLEWGERGGSVSLLMPGAGEKRDAASSLAWWEQVIKSNSMVFVLPSACNLREQGRKYLSCGRKNQAQILPPLVRMRKELGTKATSSLGAFRILLRREICQKANLKTLLSSLASQQILTPVSSRGRGQANPTSTQTPLVDPCCQLFLGIESSWFGELAPSV